MDLLWEVGVTLIHDPCLQDFFQNPHRLNQNMCFYGVTV